MRALMSVEDANDVLNSLRQAYRDERAANHVLRAQLTEAAAFLDGLADRMEKLTGFSFTRDLPKRIADCRTMAKKLRGET